MKQRTYKTGSKDEQRYLQDKLTELTAKAYVISVVSPMMHKEMQKLQEMIQSIKIEVE